MGGDFKVHNALTPSIFALSSARGRMPSKSFVDVTRIPLTYGSRLSSFRAIYDAIG